MNRNLCCYVHFKIYVAEITLSSASQIAEKVKVLKIND